MSATLVITVLPLFVQISMEAANKNAALQWLGKAKVALQEGKTEEAEKLASKSLKLCPTEYTKGG